MTMENAEEIMHCLEEFSKLKPKDIPTELNDYLGYVAKTGDPVFKWSIIKCLFREKLVKVITDFYESTLTIELPPCPNVDPFNYERMKANLLEKLDSFSRAPFTVQRISELLTNPRKEYNRADKFMRAIEKNILVVSTREPGRLADEVDPSYNGTPEPDTIIEAFPSNDLSGPPESFNDCHSAPTPAPESVADEAKPDEKESETVIRSPVQEEDKPQPVIPCLETRPDSDNSVDSSSTEDADKENFDGAEPFEDSVKVEAPESSPQLECTEESFDDDRPLDCDSSTFPGETQVEEAEPVETTEEIESVESTAEVTESHEETPREQSVIHTTAEPEPEPEPMNVDTVATPETEQLN